jgi:predicted phage tail component-like protein
MIRFQGTYPAYDESILLVGLQNEIIPEIEYTSQKIPQRAGVLGISKTHNVRTLAATYQLNGKSAARNMSLAAALAQWADSEAAGQLVLDETPDRFYFGILTNASKPDYAQEWPEVTLTFTCANPYAYSMEQHSANVGETIDYQGSVPVWPTIEYTPGSNLAQAQWTDGTRTLTISDPEYTLRAGHRIAMDCANRLATDNDVSIMAYITLFSDWLYMKRGPNTITGPGGVVKWRNVYL